jgi:hypothetical protein
MISSEKIDQKSCCDERCCDENSCTQIVDKPLNLFTGKINKYITISVAPKFIYGVLIPHPSSLILPVDYLNLLTTSVLHKLM